MQHRISRSPLLPSVFVLLAVPTGAQAHGAIKGLEGFTSGLVHPLTTPAHVLVIVALGLLLGQQKPLDLKRPLLVLMPFLAAGLAFAATGIIAEIYQFLLPGIALCVATLVALQKTIPQMARNALFALAAVAIGLDSAPEPGSAAMIVKSLLGTWIVVVFLVFDVGSYAALAGRKEWSQIGLRVIGSWIVAISLLVLAFELKK